MSKRKIKELKSEGTQIWQIDINLSLWMFIYEGNSIYICTNL